MYSQAPICFYVHIRSIKPKGWFFSFTNFGVLLPILNISIGFLYYDMHRMIKNFSKESELLKKSKSNEKKLKSTIFVIIITNVMLCLPFSILGNKNFIFILHNKFL